MKLWKEIWVVDYTGLICHWVEVYAYNCTIAQQKSIEYYYISAALAYQYNCGVEDECRNTTAQ